MKQYFNIPFPKLIDQADNEAPIPRPEHYTKQIYKEL